MDIELLSYFLPTELLEHFKIVSVKEVNEAGKIFKTLHNIKRTCGAVIRG
jgi:hypothetical protein